MDRKPVELSESRVVRRLAQLGTDLRLVERPSRHTRGESVCGPVQEVISLSDWSAANLAEKAVECPAG